MARIFLLGIILIGSMRCALADGVDDVRAAVAAMKRGDLKGVVEHYTYAIESGDLSTSQIAEVYNNRGMIFVREGRLEKAIADLNAALHADPNHPRYWGNRCLIYSVAGDYHRALPDCDEAIRIKSDFGAAYYYRGNARLELGQAERAINDYDMSVRLMPKHAVVYLQRGNAYLALKRYKEATEDYRKVITLDPDDPSPYSNMGAMHLDRGQLDQALVFFNRAVEINPRSPILLNNRCGGYRQKGDYARARADCDEAIRLGIIGRYGRGLASIYYTRGQVGESEGDQQAARQDFEKAYELSPDDPEIEAKAEEFGIVK